MVRFSEDYKNITASKELDFKIETNHCFQSQNRWLIIELDTQYNIYNLEDLSFHFSITNYQELI